MGRPSDYDPRICDLICQELVSGRSLRSITTDAAMPSIATVYKWMRDNESFLKQYELARGDQIDTFADEMLDIADDGSNDYYESTRKDGSEFIALDSENIQRSRLRVDTRKWIAERMKPRKYGQRSEIDHTHKLVDMPTVKINGKELHLDIGDGNTGDVTDPGEATAVTERDQ